MAYCGGMCLPDPATHENVTLIPDLDDKAGKQVIFCSESSCLTKSHIVYSDNTSVYLKRNLDVPVDTVHNQGIGVPSHVIELNDNFMRQIGQYPYLMESVNGLESTIVENQKANFTWKPSTNPNVYGYGIELERSVLGFAPR